MHCENFARIAKISQPKRKFRNQSENFAIPAKFSLCTYFAIITKVTVHRENLNFAMPCIFAMIAKFRYDSEIFAMIAKFTA